MIAGPQIVSAVFLATSVNWARNSLAYIAGASLSITAIVTITYFIVRGATGAAQHRSRATRESPLPWWPTLVFVAVTLFVLAIPALLVAALGERARRFSPARAIG